ncbi:winged helix-turn-helix transcriptional regulator [Kiloniella antarctica]|uniref:Winged helix-turn-helix transcriptional regulator n=1 Tax=Kiloniella antarctica TaxID=1550907 RepID=A0ABW5BK34_9PROT
MAKLHSGIPGRQAALLNATGASRTAFTQSMEHLIKIGLLERNPGHGHPLRPEFRLTPVGQAAAVIAHKILDVSEDDEQDLLRRSWTLPVLATLQRPSQFSEIKRSLLTISDRALSQSLRRMEDRKWVHRRVENEVRPPMPLYYAINTGAMIRNVTSDLTFG